MTNDLNDSLDALFTGDTGPVRTAPVRENATEFKSAEQRFEENCPKCRGTGKFIGYTGRVFGQCFTCKGKGKFSFTTSPETRAANRAADAARIARKTNEALAAFEAAHPGVWAWIKARAGSFEFAGSMVNAITRHGDLTTKQLATCERLAAADAAKAEERIERIQQAPAVDIAGIDRLKLAFDKAHAYAAAKATGLTIRNPKITIGGITISPAKADSKNAGALYVKQAGNYLGKISGAQFFASRECTPDQRERLLAFVADPAKAAKVYGQETGICCVCNATLRSEWRLRGIGPICAEKMGWADLAEDFGAI